MLADNLENLLKVIGVNDFPQETVVENGVYMDFHTDLYPFIQEGIESVSFLSNAVKRSTSNMVLCELRECVEGVWYRTKFTVSKGASCRVSLDIIGKDTYTEDKGFQVRGG